LKNYLKKRSKDNIRQGEIILKEVQTSLDFETDQTSINNLIKHFRNKDKRELYNKIGKGLISTEELAKGFRTVNSTGLFDNLIPSIFKSKSYDINSLNNQEFSHKKPFPIEETTEDSNYLLSECCRPIPGDKSIAYKNPNGYIIIHQISCPNAIKLNAEYGKSVARVQWGSHGLTQHLCNIHLKGIDRKNLVLDLTKIISSQMDVNMKSIHIDSSNGIYKGNIYLYVTNLVALNGLIFKLKKIPGIKTVERVKLQQEID